MPFCGTSAPPAAAPPTRWAPPALSSWWPPAARNPLTRTVRKGSRTGKPSAKQSLDGADAAKAEMGMKDQSTGGVGGDAASGLDAGDGEGGGTSAVHQRAREVAAALPPQVLQQAAGYGAFNAAGQYLGSKAGSTAVVAVVHERTLYVASAGDSRCVLSRGGQARQLTEDHKPAQPKEATRIYTAGSFVAPSRHGGVLRVGGSLAMSRAIGDHRFKGNPCLPPEAQAVTATPDVQAVNLGGAHDFMVLACDGVWDVMTSDQVVAAVHQGLEAGLPPAKVVQELVARCLQGSQLPGASSDNITILLVVFLAQLQQQGGQQQGQQQGQ
ncbi:phosphatase 2C-like domain-containing protein [Haematococcus lacustris]